MQILTDLQHGAIKAEGWALNNQTMVSVISLWRRKTLEEADLMPRWKRRSELEAGSFASRFLRISPLLIAQPGSESLHGLSPKSFERPLVNRLPNQLRQLK
jgi:hypothetical protein